MQEKSNEPIWFDKEPVQTIDLTEQLKGHTLPPPSKYRIMVATPVHSEVGIHYVRALQRSQNATFEDLPEDEQNKLSDNS